MNIEKHKDEILFEGLKDLVEYIDLVEYASGEMMVSADRKEKMMLSFLDELTVSIKALKKEYEG